MFAKLFETESTGQILIKLDSGEGDTEAEVRFYVEPPNLGVCSFAAGFKGDDAWDKAQALFDKMDEAAAIETVQPFIASAAQFAPKNEGE
jgi:hypothetical protein